MSLLLSGLQSQVRKSRLKTRAASDDVVLTVTFLLIAVLSFLIVKDSVHLVLALAFLPLVFAVVWISPRRCISFIVVWTVLLGLLRRVIPGGTSAGLSGDPLVLIGPLVICLLFAVAVRQGAFRGRSPFANAVALMTLIAVVEAANPLQDSYEVGLGGILYIVVPILSFWIGRSILQRDDVRRIVVLVGSLAFMEAVYGLFQTLVGFPPWDQKWLKSAGYIALNVGGGTRAFGTFASASEYAIFIGIGFVIWVVVFMWCRKPWYKAGCLMVLGTLGAAVTLESSRGVFVLTGAATAVVVAVRTRRKLWGAAIAVVIALLLLYFLAGEFLGSQPSSSTGTSSISGLLYHLFDGLARPGQSDLAGKVGLVITALGRAVTEPLGHGTGSVTIAAGKFQTAQLTHTRITGVDLGSMAIAFGIVGVIVYLVVLVRGVTSTYGLARRRHQFLFFAVLGIILVPALQWFNGDNYSVCWLVWLILGFADRCNVDDLERARTMNELRADDLLLPASTGPPSGDPTR